MGLFGRKHKQSDRDADDWLMNLPRDAEVGDVVALGKPEVDDFSEGMTLPGPDGAEPLATGSVETGSSDASDGDWHLPDLDAEPAADDTDGLDSPPALPDPTDSDPFEREVPMNQPVAGTAPSAEPRMGIPEPPAPPDTIESATARNASAPPPPPPPPDNFSVPAALQGRGLVPPTPRPSAPLFLAAGSAVGQSSSGSDPASIPLNTDWGQTEAVTWDLDPEPELDSIEAGRRPTGVTRQEALALQNAEAAEQNAEAAEQNAEAAEQNAEAAEQNAQAVEQETVEQSADDFESYGFVSEGYTTAASPEEPTEPVDPSSIPSGPDAERYLEILGLAPGATWSEIGSAHRTVLEDYASDRFVDPQQMALAVEIRREMNTAYAALRVQAVA